MKPFNSINKKTFRFHGHFGIKILAASFLLLFLLAGSAESRGLTVRRKAREYRVEATIDRYPLTLGDNYIDIEIKDGAGKSVTGADVLVNYYMPPMPRMVPMNYKTEARLKSDTYEAKMKIIMAGPWYIKIIIKHKGKISTAKFNVDAQ
jgi:YtkA-like